VFSVRGQKEEEWEVCAVGECRRELGDVDCHLITEIGGKVISSQNKWEGGVERIML